MCIRDSLLFGHSFTPLTLRRRLSLMARRCQLQMLGVADAHDAVDESQSMCMYDDFSKRPFAPCLEHKNEADVAAFAREALMSLCSTEPARPRRRREIG